MEENVNYLGYRITDQANSVIGQFGPNLTGHLMYTTSTTSNTNSGFTSAEFTSKDIRDLKNTVKELQKEVDELRQKLKVARSYNEKEHRKLTS